MVIEINEQSFPTGKSCPTISYFETLPIGSSTHSQIGLPVDKSRTVQVTATVFS